MKSLYLIGGQQKYLRPLFSNDTDWYEYDKGVAVRLNLEAGTAQTLLEYKSPWRTENEKTAPTLFKSGSIEGNILYLCTQTEVMLYHLPDFKQITYISLPSFNDVHHVRPTPRGTLVVASSGLDMIVEITPAGQRVREWPVLDEDPWTRFSRETDYRMVNTKPHRAHPNFLFYVDNQLWATRFYQRDAICLEDHSRRIPIALGAPHDGLQHGDYVIFTTVNGFVVIVHKQTLKVDEIIDLNAIHQDASPLGWCRGVLMEDEKIWVGFSRIRPTRLRENLEWAKRQLKWGIKSLLHESADEERQLWLDRERPSHVACYDLKRRTCVQEIDLEAHGISALFSLFSADGYELATRSEVSGSMQPAAGTTASI